LYIATQNQEIQRNGEILQFIEYYFHHAMIITGDTPIPLDCETPQEFPRVINR